MLQSDATINLLDRKRIFSYTTKFIAFHAKHRNRCLEAETVRLSEVPFTPGSLFTDVPIGQAAGI